jgi:hypothetical protein
MLTDMMNVTRFAIVPGRHHPLGVRHHRVAVELDFVPVKGWLGEAPVLQPGIAFVGQKAVSKDSAIQSDSLPFDETLVVGNKNVFGKVGVVKEIEVAGKSAVVKDVTISASPLRVQSERVPAS